MTATHSPASAWATTDLRALAAYIARDLGTAIADLEDTNPDLCAVAAQQFGDNEADMLTDADLDAVRGMLRRAVIEVDGTRYNEEV